MKSIEKLRELAADINSTEIIDHLDVVGMFMFRSEWLDSWHKAFDAACDQIEAEIAERYMELPKDADGVPIHEGDVLECHANEYDGQFEVFAVNENTVVGNHDIEWVRRNPSKWFHCARYCHHVKPRTIVDVLHDFWEEWESHPIDAEWDVRLERLRESEVKYAAEIRELLVVSE